MSSSNLKQSNITKSFNPQNTIAHSESYSSLLNLRTTLLHMQYLYASLSQKLERQHINQENQHQDHLIQCYNMKEELEELKKNNFAKLFIVKLEEFLAIEESVNLQIMSQPEVPSTALIKPNSLHISSQNASLLPKDPSDEALRFKQQLDFISKIQKLLTFVKIKEEEMQNSLCKLYIGSKVLLDLPKTANSIQQIESKIDDFITKHNQTLALYNGKIKDLEQTKADYRNYLGSVDQKIKGLNEKENELDKITQAQNSSEFVKNKNRPYQSHIKTRLSGEAKSIDNRLNDLKQKLLIYS